MGGNDTNKDDDAVETPLVRMETVPKLNEQKQVICC